MKKPMISEIPSNLARALDVATTAARQYLDDKWGESHVEVSWHFEKSLTLVKLSVYRTSKYQVEYKQHYYCVFARCSTKTWWYLTPRGANERMRLIREESTGRFK